MPCRPVKDLLDKRLVIVTGKGGVGKSTVALALGMAGREGREADDPLRGRVAGALSRVFEHAEVGFHEIEMDEQLWAISIDPDESMREYVLLAAEGQARCATSCSARGSSPTSPPPRRASASW